MIPELFTNKLFISVLLAGFVAQLLKIIILIVKDKQPIHLSDIVVTGRMPSMHSAVVCALATSAYFTEGINSLFIVTLVLAAIVLRDSLGVRRTVGEHGKIINKLINELELKIDNAHYSMGHKPLEVIIGLIIGIFSAALIQLIL